MGGTSAIEGRVEVRSGGAWGTVCDDSFGTDDARVVCRELGLSGGTHVSQAYFGMGETTEPIWLDDVECSGTEAAPR